MSTYKGLGGLATGESFETAYCPELNVNSFLGWPHSAYTWTRSGRLEQLWLREHAAYERDPSISDYAAFNAGRLA